MLMNFAELGRFYHNLAALDHAGIHYLKAFENLKRGEPNSDRQYQFQFMINHLGKNRPLADGLRFIKLVPAFDIPMIKAAENSGRLVEVFKILSKKYADADESQKEITSRLMQPGFTLLVAIFAPKVPDLFAEKITTGQYLRVTLIPLGVIVFGVYSLYQMWMRSFYDLKTAALLHKVMSYIPFFKGLNKKMSLQKFSSSLAMMLDSGMDLFESLRQASETSADPEIKASVDQLIPIIRQGVDIARVFQTIPYFPHELVNAISLGADSGKLPEFLNRYGDQLKGEIDRALKILTKVIPTVVFVLVMLYVLAGLIGFYKGHLDDAMKVLDNV